LSTKSTKSTKKTSAVGFSLTAAYPAFLHRLPRQAPYVIHPGLWDAVVLGQIFAPAISAFPTSLWVMPEPRHREVKLRVTQVSTGCVVIPRVLGRAVGKKPVYLATF